METPTTTDTSTLAVPLNADGTIGTLPDPLQKFFESKLKDALKRGQAQTASPDPVERERLRQLEAENQAFKVADAERDKRYEEALTLRDTEYTAKLTAAKAEVDKRHARLLVSLGAELRAAALQAGVSDEALVPLEAVLRPRLALSDTLDPVVLVDGKPSDLTIAQLVQEEVDSRPSVYRAKPTGASGGSRNGASLSGGNGPVQQADAELDSAKSALARDPTNALLVDAVFKATRAQTAARRGPVR